MPNDLAAATERMRRLARALVGNAHDAEDVAQDAWCQALRPGSAAKDSDAWLNGVARNVARHHGRAGRRRMRREAAAARSESQSPDQLALDHIEAVHSLVEVVRSLPQPYRSALVLQYVVGMAPAEAAEALGVNRATLRSRVHRGLEMVRAELERRSQRDWKMTIAPLVAGSTRIALGGLLVTKATSWSGITVLLLLIGGGVLWVFNAESEKREARIPETISTDSTVETETPDTPLLTGAVGSRDPRDTPVSVWPIRVRVVDEQGRAVPDAALYFVPEMATSVLVSSTTQFHTGEDGEVEVARPPATSSVLLVRANGHVPEERNLGDLEAASGAGSGSVEFRLRRGGTAGGIVLDGMGKPVAGVAVYALGRAGNEVLADGHTMLPGRRTAGALQSVRTDQAGRFEIAGIRTFPVELVAAGEFCLHRHAGTPPRAEENGASVEIRVARLLYVDVKAKDRATGEVLRSVQWEFATPSGRMDTVDGNLTLELQQSGPRSHISGWRDDGTYRQYFAVYGDPSLKGYAPIVTVRAPGYEDQRREVQPLLMRRPRAGDSRAVQVFELDEAKGVDEWGHLTLDVSLNGVDQAPGWIWLSLTPIPEIPDDPGSPSAAGFRRIRVPLSPKPNGHGVALLRLPRGRHEAAAHIHVGINLPRQNLGEITIRSDEHASLVLRATVSRLRIHVEDESGNRLHDFHGNIYRLQDGAPRGVLLQPLVMLTRLSWRHDPMFAEGRRLGRMGPYLGELLVPPGRYGIHVAREGYERGWKEVTLAETPGAVDVHFVLKADR